MCHYQLLFGHCSLCNILLTHSILWVYPQESSFLVHKYIFSYTVQFRNTFGIMMIFIFKNHLINISECHLCAKYCTTDRVRQHSRKHTIISMMEITCLGVKTQISVTICSTSFLSPTYKMTCETIFWRQKGLRYTIIQGKSTAERKNGLCHCAEVEIDYMCWRSSRETEIATQNEWGGRSKAEKPQLFLWFSLRMTEDAVGGHGDQEWSAVEMPFSCPGVDTVSGHMGKKNNQLGNIII